MTGTDLAAEGIGNMELIGQGQPHSSWPLRAWRPGPSAVTEQSPGQAPKPPASHVSSPLQGFSVARRFERGTRAYSNSRTFRAAGGLRFCMSPRPASQSQTDSFRFTALMVGRGGHGVLLRTLQASGQKNGCHLKLASDMSAFTALATTRTGPSRSRAL